MIPALVTFATIHAVVLVASVTVSFPRLPDQFLDPCKAAGYMGDIALQENEFQAVKKTVLKLTTRSNESQSLFEQQVETDDLTKRDITRRNSDMKKHKELEKVRHYFTQVLKHKLEVLKRTCKQENEDQCRREKNMLRKEIVKTRVKRLRLKESQRHARHRDIDVNSFKRDIICEGKQTTNCSSLKRKKKIRTRRSLIHRRETNSKINHSRQRRAATELQDRLWEFGVIPFVMDNIFSGGTKARFRLAMDMWEDNTCLTFIDRQSDEKHYIIYTKGTCGCCSPVGRTGSGGQAVSIGEGCDKLGIVLHELGHAIGFWHEHTRPDRDSFVIIKSENIEVDEKYNFDIRTDINSLNETYDYDSIMHYAQNQFAIVKNLDTILPVRRPSVIFTPVIGQRIKPSLGDIRQVNKLYNCPLCGRTMRKSFDIFSHVPKLGKAELCQWRISCVHGERIVLNITNLDLPISPNCENDYLEVRDGHYLKSPLLGRFCGDHLPDTLMSTGNRMWIEYKTNNGEGQGFSGSYEIICGGELIGEEGFLTSPDYPHEYPRRKTCTWRITVPENYTVAIAFDLFDVESDAKCRYDYLEIRDGSDGQAPLIGVFCGSEIQDYILSTDRHMYVKFVSDSDVQLSGFSATFVKEVDECLTDYHGCEQSCVNTLGSYHCACRLNYQLHSDGKRCEATCGGIIEETSGNITSPSFPDLYPANRKCIWSINAPEDHNIQLIFTYFDVEGKIRGCDYDSVQVSADDELLGVFCGYLLPVPIISPANVLRIEFISDKTVQNTGFSATFTTDKDECSVDNGGCEHICENTIGSYVCECQEGYVLRNDKHGCRKGSCHFEIYSPEESIYSPNFPKDYPSRADCLWHLNTAYGHRIKLSFIEFNVEYNQECAYDYVAVYDGDDISSASLGKFCGPPENKPNPIISSGNNMLINLISDASVGRSGFRAFYDVVCGGHLVASFTSQEFVSHASFGEKDYNNRADCEWLIEAGEGHRLRMTFSQFEVENSENCEYDVVTVYDGSEETDPLIGKLCGHDIPGLILSTTKYLLIRFHTDDTIGKKGFSASYQIDSPPTDYMSNVSSL